MKCKKCKLEMQMQVVSETAPETTADKMRHAGQAMMPIIGGIMRHHEKPKPTIAVTYAVCPKCGRTEKIEQKRGLFGRG